MGKASSRMNTLAVVSGVVTGVGAAYWFAVRPQHRRWGATADEVRAFWSGDDLLPRPLVSATHAVTIQASPEKVWPWLVQIGQGRGGLHGERRPYPA